MPRQPVASSSIPGRSVYLPAITAARWVRRYQLGLYRAVLCTECPSDGDVHYSHVLYVFGGDELRPILAVTAEYTDDTGKGGQRCLSVFHKGVHVNYGFSHEWTELEAFVREALQLAAEQLGVSVPPESQVPPAS